MNNFNQDAENSAKLVLTVAFFMITAMTAPFWVPLFLLYGFLRLIISAFKKASSK